MTMTMRPFYRSRLFWLGAVGLVFLLWVWWDSGKRGTKVEWAHGQGWHEVWVAAGQVKWQVMTPAMGMPSGIHGQGYGLPGSRAFEMPPAFTREKHRGAFVLADFVIVTVGLWVIVVGYGAMWLAAVCGWQCWKRKRRVKDLIEAEVAS